MRLFGQVGNFSKVSFNQSAGFKPLSLAVPTKVCIAAARRPARSEPTNSQFFLPKANRTDAVFNGVIIDGRVAGFRVAT